MRWVVVRYALQLIHEVLVFQKYFGSTRLELRCPTVSDWTEVTPPMKNHFTIVHLKNHFAIVHLKLFFFQIHLCWGGWGGYSCPRTAMVIHSVPVGRTPVGRTTSLPTEKRTIHHWAIAVRFPKHLFNCYQDRTSSSELKRVAIFNISSQPVSVGSMWDADLRAWRI